MRTQSFARLAVLVSAALMVTGCAADDADGHDGSTAPPLQLRLVTSTEAGACTAPPLTADGPGTACDLEGTTTYELAESLGVVTPTAVTRDAPAGAHAVGVEFDKADATTLKEVTSKAINEELALLLNGKVLSAATVHDPITTGTFIFGFGNASDADRAAALLGASSTS
ncbi:SecDF P1 head subdomain-containing protein [Cellulomonas sp. McL0617]|uniref:SecDF P1 head subdomain-containing protein n=1 Tax=Cellulomonas sp. McL0617 TaxID=3415675 RepID=UPI003CE67656